MIRAINGILFFLHILPLQSTRSCQKRIYLRYFEKNKIKKRRFTCGLGFSVVLAANIISGGFIVWLSRVYNVRMWLSVYLFSFENLVSRLYNTFALQCIKEKISFFHFVVFFICSHFAFSLFLFTSISIWCVRYSDIYFYSRNSHGKNSSSILWYSFT